VKYRAANDPEVAQFHDYTTKSIDTTQGLSEIKNEVEFQTLLETRPNDRNFNWRTVEYIQTCVKDDKGIGK